MVVTDFKLGQLALAHAVTTNIAACSRIAGVDRRTMKKYVATGFNKIRKARSVPAKIVKRRNVLRQLAAKVCKKGHRTWPKYGSAEQLRSALFQSTGENLSRRQVSRELHAAGLNSYVRQPVPTRATADLKKRKDFAKKCRALTPKELRSIVFSDESWLSCVERTGKHQWAKKKTDVHPLEKKCRWNLPSIMVWGCVGHNYKSKLVFFPAKTDKDGEIKQFRLDAQQYVRRCVSTVAKDLVTMKRIFQQDGARSHAARTTIAYLNRKEIRYLDNFPPYSPDLNVIERMWNELHHRVGATCPMTQEELIEAALKAWESIPQSLINKHCAHFATQIRRM